MNSGNELARSLAVSIRSADFVTSIGERTPVNGVLSFFFFCYLSVTLEIYLKSNVCSRTNSDAGLLSPANSNAQRLREGSRTLRKARLSNRIARSPDKLSVVRLVQVERERWHIVRRRNGWVLAYRRRTAVRRIRRQFDRQVRRQRSGTNRLHGAIERLVGERCIARRRIRRLVA